MDELFDAVDIELEDAEDMIEENELSDGSTWRRAQFDE